LKKLTCPPGAIPGTPAAIAGAIPGGIPGCIPGAPIAGGAMPGAPIPGAIPGGIPGIPCNVIGLLNDSLLITSSLTCIGIAGIPPGPTLMGAPTIG